MATSRKGTNFKEFAATLRYPPLQFDNPATTDPLQTPRAQFLKDFATNVLNDVLNDIKEDGLETFANEYNKQPFKAYAAKVKEDESLKNPLNKAAKAALVDEANLRGGDPFAEVLNDLIDSLSPDQATVFQGTGVFGKGEASVKAREELLAAMGVNSIKLLGFIGISALARSIPIEAITQFNVEQYLKYLDPVFLINKLIEGIKNKDVKDAVNDFKLVGKFVNSVLSSTQFETKLQQAFTDYLKTQPDVPESLRNIARFDEVLAIVNPDNITGDGTDTDAFKAVSTASIDFLQNGKLGIDLKVVSRDVNGQVLGELSLSNLSEDMTGLVTGAQDDLQSIFDDLESCELPDPDTFNKYRVLGKAIKEFFKGFKPLRLNKKDKETDQKRFKIPDRQELIESALLSVLVSSFYVATFTLFKLVLSYLQKLVPDLSCAQIAAMIVPEEELGPREQNSAVNSDALATKILNSIRAKYPRGGNNINVSDIASLLAEIASSIGMFNGLDINTLNEFLSISTSVLTQREYCELLSGTPTQDTITIIQAIIDTRYPDRGISKDPEDIIKFFSALSNIAGVGCEAVLSNVDLPVNTILCSTPEYYRIYNDLRIALLREKGLTDGDINIQINKICDLNAQQVQQFLDLLNNDDPLDSMIPTITTNEPNCGIETSIAPVNQIIKNELARSYTNVFEPLKQSLDSNMIGDRGFMANILAGKNGVSYPTYLVISKILNDSMTDQTFLNSLTAGLSDVPVNMTFDDNDYNILRPSLVASWLRMNQEEFCSLSLNNRMLVTPLTTRPQIYDSFPDPFAVTNGFTDYDRQRLLAFYELTQDTTSLLTYDDIFLRLGSIYFAVRGLSFTGIHDLSQSSIRNLTFDGIKQANLSAGALVEVLVGNPGPSGIHKLLPIVKKGLISIGELRSAVSTNAAFIELPKPKAPIRIPGVDKPISAEPRAAQYRIKSYNFFILPLTTPEATVGQIRTKIIDYLPSSLVLDSTDNGPKTWLEYGLSGTLPIGSKAESELLLLNPESQFNSLKKYIEVKEIIKQPSDYYIGIDQTTTAAPTIEDLLDEGTLSSGSRQSLVFGEIVLNSIKNNLGISMEQIPDVQKYAKYIIRDLYNYVYNSYFDGMSKIPAFNGKNLNYGTTDQRINPLNRLHVNTITGAPDPVDPAVYGGTELEPSFYIYNKLTDDWKNIFNLYTRESNNETNPPRTPVPDFNYFATKAADLYMRMKEETRDASDYSNQLPFDLIVSKASMVTMDSLIDMMLKVYSFENYYKAFSFLNTVEITDNIFDKVYFDFLADRFRDYAIQAGPPVGREKRKTSKFYHMFMEIYVTMMFKKRESKFLAVTEEEEAILKELSRKSNIWRLGIPSQGLTAAETEYLDAATIIAGYEAPGFPNGTLSNAAGSSLGSTGPVNRLFAEAEKQRQQQIKIRNDYWNKIMVDCEPLFTRLLSIRLGFELRDISNQMAILNPDLIKENSILNMPVNGGPIVQNGDPSIKTDETAIMRNVYDYHPAMMYSAANILISDNAYNRFYGTQEDNNDRNFNGFLFNRMYENQNYNLGSVTIKANPKEPVYSYSDVYDEDVYSDINFRTVNNINGNNLDAAKYSPDFLTPNVLNYYELKKRDITVNNFLLSNNFSKAGRDVGNIAWNNFFTFQYDASGSKDFERKLKDQGQNVYISISNANINGIIEQTVNSIKRFKVLKTDGCNFERYYKDAYLIGGPSASNLPMIMSQVPAPIVLEQYVNLNLLTEAEALTSQIASAYIDPDSGQNIFLNLRSGLEKILLNPDAAYSGVLNEEVPISSGVFTGPSSLSALIYWLGNTGFFDGRVVGATGGQTQSDAFNILDFKVKDFFRPGTFTAGIRLMLMQPDSNLTIGEGTHTYFEEQLLESLNVDTTAGQASAAVGSALGSQTAINDKLRDRIRFSKSFTKETGYAIPLFKAEESVEWTLRDLKAIYDAYISTNNGDGYGNIETTPTKWIDHTRLTRLLNIRMLNTIICSEEYKKLFDFCVPLRYFASLTAIYTTKAFTNSIGSAIDWGGISKIDKKVFKRDEKNVLAPFYQTLRKVFYQSYNSFDPFYEGENDENTTIEDEEDNKDRNGILQSVVDRNDALLKISTIQSDILWANQIDPLFRENLGDLRDIIGSGYEKDQVADPTNGNGSANE